MNFRPIDARTVDSGVVDGKGLNLDSTAEPSSIQAFRGLLAVAGGAVVAGLGLLLWWWLKLATMSSYIGFSLFFMPLLIGVAVGLVVRLSTQRRGYILAGLAVAMVTVAGLAGMGMQHFLEVDEYLQRMAGVTYDETLHYAQWSAKMQTTNEVRAMMAKSDVAILGRMASHEEFTRIEDFWFVRNMMHLNWVASRRIVGYGQSGPAKTILEASRVADSPWLMRQMVEAYGKNPIADTEVAHFFKWEQPVLEQVALGDISRASFERPLVEVVRSNLHWQTLVSSGFGPISGSFLMFGCLVAHLLILHNNAPPMEEY